MFLSKHVSVHKRFFPLCILSNISQVIKSIGMKMCRLKKILHSCVTDRYLNRNVYVPFLIKLISPRNLIAAVVILKAQHSYEFPQGVFPYFWSIQGGQPNVYSEISYSLTSSSVRAFLSLCTFLAQPDLFGRKIQLCFPIMCFHKRSIHRIER